MLVVGGLVWVVGFAFESVGDLAAGAVPRRSRQPGPGDGPRAVALHPSPQLLRRRLLWWGIFLVACVQWQGVLTVLSPVLMTWTLVAKTGKPLLERDMAKRRPGYADYVERTSGFVPWPRNRGRARTD